jgi:hypothetical protein
MMRPDFFVFSPTARKLMPLATQSEAFRVASLPILTERPRL